MFTDLHCLVLSFFSQLFIGWCISDCRIFDLIVVIKTSVETRQITVTTCHEVTYVCRLDNW